jgi:hypothetical protein
VKKGNQDQEVDRQEMNQEGMLKVKIDINHQMRIKSSYLNLLEQV